MPIELAMDRLRLLLFLPGLLLDVAPSFDGSRRMLLLEPDFLRRLPFRDDGDDNDGQKDGEYLPKIRSAGLTTGKKRPLLRQRERAVSKRLRFDDSN